MKYFMSFFVLKKKLIHLVDFLQKKNEKTFYHIYTIL